MSHRTLILALVALTAACDQNLTGPEPLEPEAESGQIEVQGVANATSSWVEHIKLWDGVKIHRSRYDQVRYVIGLGKYWAKKAAYVPGGGDSFDRNGQIYLFNQLGRAMGISIVGELYNNTNWFRRVKDGKSVGLWIQLWQNPDGTYRVVAVEQRPKGSHTIPF